MVTNHKCNKCGKKASVKFSYLEKAYCNKCFVELIEKRVRKDIRINKKVHTGEVELLNDYSKEFKVAKILLKNIFGDYLNIKEVKKARNKTIIPTNLDREIKEKLSVYLKNKKETKGNVKILNNVLEQEIIDYCKIKNIPITNLEEKNELIEALEKTTPGTKFALAKSFETIFRKSSGKN